MTDIIGPARSNVPVVGLPMWIGDANVIVPVSCSCRPGNRPMTILGTNHIVKCRWCGHEFAIMRATFDRRAGEALQVEVGLIVRGVNGG